MQLHYRPPARASARLTLASLACANFAIGMGAFVVIGILSPISSGLGLTHTEAGMVMSVYAIAYAIASPLSIAASGKLPRRSVILLGLTIVLAASILSALAPTLEILLLARALGALGAGMVTPVGAAIAIALSAPERRGAALASVFLGLTLAQVAGIPAGSFVGYSVGWRAAFWMVAAFSALSLIGVARLVPRDVRTPVVTLADVGRTLAAPALMLAILVMASTTAAGYMLFTYFAPLLEQTMGYGRNGIALILLLYGGGAVLGNLMGGGLVDRIGAVRAAVLITAGQAAVMPLFSALPLPGIALAALAVAWGITTWSFMVPQQSRLVALAPERQNVTLALNASSIYLGGAIGAAAGGLVVDNLGFGALGWVAGLAGALVLAHLLVSIRLSRGAKRRRLSAAE
jgi:DHA1 family inner membrane transport protein